MGSLSYNILCRKCSHWVEMIEIRSGTNRWSHSLHLHYPSPVQCKNMSLHCFRYRGEILPNNYKVTVPTMIIWGTHDFALSTSMVAASAKWIPDLQVKYIPSAGHWVQQQEPEKVNKYMREFLRNS